MFDERYEPALHIVPLNPDSKMPVAFVSDDSEGTLAAVTENGRVSFFPLDVNTVVIDGGQLSKTIPVVNAIASRIEQHFPDDKDSDGNPVIQYLAVGVMYDNHEQDRAKFIYEVCGFNKQFIELDLIYNTLASLGDTATYSREYNEKEEYLSSEPMRGWINKLIAYLNNQLNWPEYVKKALEQTIPDEEDEIDCLIESLLRA